jgi:hypothetical protein
MSGLRSRSANVSGTTDEITNNGTASEMDKNITRGKTEFEIVLIPNLI